MKKILRGGIIVLALIGLVVAGSTTVVADSHDTPSGACGALADAGDQAASQAQDGLDRANDENDCRDVGPIPDPEE